MNPQNAETPELPPVCQSTADRLNRVLDGELEAAALDADPHPAGCPACRERVAAARILLSVLAEPEPVAAPPGMASRVLAALHQDRAANVRRRSRAVAAAACALAASVAIALWLSRTPPTPVGPTGPAPETANVAPAPTPETAPEPRPAVPPLRIGDELAKAGLALRGTPKSMAEPVAAAPEVLSKLTDALTRPLAPAGGDMEPARAALADLPDAARTGLEPVTGTAQKAFSRLLRDVGAIGSKPKS